MKKFVILLSLLFAFQFVLKAQVAIDDDDVIFNVHLLETFEIAVIAGGVQEITFLTPADYNDGVDESGGIVDGVSDVTVNATGTWDIIIGADNFSPGVGATGIIDIDNLGFWIESIGTYTLGGEVTLPNGNDAPENSLAMPLTGTDVVILGNGSGNTGGELENTFRFHWEMGTRRTNPAGPMNSATMFSQLAAGLFSLGDFSTTAVLTLRKL
jgi:hypothetical protein